MKPWLSPTQWARACETLYWPGDETREDTEKRLAEFFAVLMWQVLDAVQDIPSRGMHKGKHRYVDAKDLYEKFRRFNLSTGMVDAVDATTEMIEHIAQPLFDSIQAKMPVAKFLQKPKKRRRKP